MLPMDCPACSHSIHRATSTNGRLPDQIVRRRVCQGCGHAWFTVEAMVPSYAVGWSTAHQRKPVLRMPVHVETGYTRSRLRHEEAQDPRDNLTQEWNEQGSREADARHRVTDCE